MIHSATKYENGKARLLFAADLMKYLVQSMLALRISGVYDADDKYSSAQTIDECVRRVSMASQDRASRDKTFFYSDMTSQTSTPGTTSSLSFYCRPCWHRRWQAISRNHSPYPPFGYPSLNPQPTSGGGGNQNFLNPNTKLPRDSRRLQLIAHRSVSPLNEALKPQVLIKPSTLRPKP